MSIPVYIFTGFLESGKTSFIRDTLRDPGFTDNEKTLLIACEDGEEEYDEAFLKETNSVLLQIDDLEEFTTELLDKAAKMQKPDRILLEYNGMWEMQLIQKQFPRNWEIYQIVTTINAETYQVYLNNMGPKIIAHVGASELVVFNRCTPELNEMIRKTNVKAMNPRAYIYLEDNEGNAEDYNEGLPLPYDLEAPVVNIKPDDFGTWYIDALNEPKKYDGLTVKFKAEAHKRKEDPDDRFLAGRFAMVCCADDVSFIGFFAVWPEAAEKIRGENVFAEMTAKIKVEYDPEFHGDAPVLYIQDFQEMVPPEDKLLYFR